MSQRTLYTSRFQFTLLLGLLSAFLVFSIIMFPEKSFDASLQSLTIWWTIVFPALLPFVIIAEIMLAYGLIHFFGTLLAPGMRLLFGLPGVSGPVMAIGFTVGYPIGAKLTQRLRQSEALSKTEGEMLLTLSHMASPLLMINVIAVGFFRNAQLGLILTLIQLTSLFAMGVILRLCLAREPELNKRASEDNHANLLRSAVDAMRRAHRTDGRTFGKLLGDAVSTAIQTLMMIGGFMMIFAVVIQVIVSTQLTDLLYVLPNHFMSEHMSASLFKGFFEVHLGSFAIGEVIDMPLQWQLATVSALLAWSGLSMHAQVTSLIQKSDLRYSIFLIARMLQAALAFVFTFFLWAPLSKLLNQAAPSFLYMDPMYDRSSSDFLQISTLWARSMMLMTLLLLTMATISLLIALTKKTYNHRKN